MTGVPILEPAHVWGDNKGVVNITSIPETSTTKKILVFFTMQSVRPQYKAFRMLASVRGLKKLRIVLTIYHQALLRKSRC